MTRNCDGSDHLMQRREADMEEERGLIAERLLWHDRIRGKASHDC